MIYGIPLIVQLYLNLETFDNIKFTLYAVLARITCRGHGTGGGGGAATLYAPRRPTAAEGQGGESQQGMS